MHLLGDNINTLKKKKTDTLIDASKEVGLEVKAEKSRCMPLARYRIMTKIENRFFENVAQFKYLGKTITNNNLIEEENKR
jgi:hypothetical protein